MGINNLSDADYFLELQTRTGWGRTLADFAHWCRPLPGSLVLDIGCGPGLLLAIFRQSGCVAVGVDLDSKMFEPKPLHPLVVVSDGYNLPFPMACFDLVTASNLLFLLPDPYPLLAEIKRVLRVGGEVALLNPSEILTVKGAIKFVEERGLQGLARDTFLNWARRAEENHRWDSEAMSRVFNSVGLTLSESILKIGPGFARYSRGRV